MLNAKITGLGMCVPPDILYNDYFERMVETSNEWIIKRTGIEARHVVNKEKPSDLAAVAALRALEKSGLRADELDLIIVATVRGDYHFPSCACLVQDKIKAVNAAAFDINAGCTGFIYGLDLASAYIRSGAYRKILLIGVEVLTDITDYSDRNTCILFGDGAGAAVIEESYDSSGIIASKIFSDGSKKNLLYCENMPNGQELLRMNGNELFKLAVRGMAQACQWILEKTGHKIEDIDVIVPHQANIRIIESVAKMEQLNIPPEKIALNIEKYGNMSAASIPVAAIEAEESELITKNKLVLFDAFGAGLTWGAALIRW